MLQNITDVKGLKRMADGSIRCFILMPSLSSEYIPFSASPDDTEPHGVELFSLIESGAYGDIAPHTDADAESEEISKNKAIAAELINAADKKIMPLLSYKMAGVMTEDQEVMFIALNEYRQRLESMDLEKIPADWPDRPE